MRRETAEDIRKMLTEIEMARASAEDELETQRILTETARVRAFSHGLANEAAPIEMAKSNEKVDRLGNLRNWESGLQEAESTVAAGEQKAQPVSRSSSRRSSSRRTNVAIAKKPAAKKPAAKKTVAKKAVAKKAPAKKPIAKKTVAKKPAVKKAVARKAPVKKAVAKKPASRIAAKKAA
jgi:histone H1/5